MIRLIQYGVGMVRLKFVFATVFLNSPLMAEPASVLMLGDSLTHGYGLPADQGLVPRLEEWLQGRGHDVSLINAGVSGDTTAGGLARINWLLTDDLDAIVIELGANDALRGIDPVHISQNLAAMVDVAQQADLPVLLMRVPSVGNFGTEYRESYNVAFTDAARQERVHLVENFFNALSDMEPVRLQQVMQPDGTHPNAEGVAMIVDDIGPDLAKFLQVEVFD